jgi:hypothetical protein
VEDLSIQVHPNDELARKSQFFGKTEMWYIGSEGCKNNCRFQGEIKFKRIFRKSKNKTLLSILMMWKVKGCFSWKQEPFTLLVRDYCC